MTQKDKLIKARMFALRVKNSASNLVEEAKDYDVRFPVPIANSLIKGAEELLKLF